MRYGALLKDKQMTVTSRALTDTPDHVFPLLAALRGNRQEQAPLWLMRQAGRYLPEYRELRAKKGGFMAMAMDPVAACEITMQPIRRFGMDAAIIFSDILTVPHALGQSLDFVQGEGPVLNPLRVADDFNVLSFDRFDELMAPVYEAIRQTRSALKREGFYNTALIGFAGAPWTVATYMVEGGSSKDFAHTKALAYGSPEIFAGLIDTLSAATTRYLIAQIEAGAQAVQIFDSWAGALDPQQFEYWALKPAQKIVAAVHAAYPDIPVIGFPKGAGLNYTRYAKDSGIDAIGMDSSLDPVWAANHLQTILPVQGNLDPACLLAGGDALENAIARIMNHLAGKAFVFNLGHGIHKETPLAHVETLVRLVREYRA